MAEYSLRISGRNSSHPKRTYFFTNKKKTRVLCVHNLDVIAFRSCLTYDLLYDRTSHNSDRQWFYFWPNIMVGLDRENTASYGDIKQISAVVHMYLLVVGYSTILTEIHPRPRHPKRSNPLQIVKKGLLNKKKILVNR